MLVDVSPPGMSYTYVHVHTVRVCTYICKVCTVAPTLQFTCNLHCICMYGITWIWMFVHMCCCFSHDDAVRIGSQGLLAVHYSAFGRVYDRFTSVLCICVHTLCGLLMLDCVAANVRQRESVDYTWY